MGGEAHEGATGEDFQRHSGGRGACVHRDRPSSVMWFLAFLSLFSLALATPAEPASKRGTRIVVRYTRQEIPLEPAAKLWRKNPPARIPLKAQDLSEPYGGGSIKAVTIRAIHNGRELAFLLEWVDPTKDATTNGLDSF